MRSAASLTRQQRPAAAAWLKRLFRANTDFRKTPLYIYGEAQHQVFYYYPDSNGYKALGELGYESTHLGLSLRGGYFSGPFESLTYNQLGGTLFYRFVRWNLMTTDESMFLNREERKAAADRNKRETNEDIPKAPLLGISYDQLSLSSAISKYPSISPLRLGLWLSATLEPYFTFIPSVSVFEYNELPSTDPAASSSYGSSALRLVRLGPNGPYSGIYGCPTDTEQLYTEVKLFPMLQIDAALTRVSLDTPSSVAYSFWLGFDRFLSPDKAWAISPSYEQVFLGGQLLSYFTISLRFGAAERYLPPGEK